MARRRATGRRADLRWLFSRNNFSAISAGTSANTQITSGNTSQTIMRTRGSIVAYLDGVQAPGSLIAVSVGFIVMPGGSGTTVTSSPETDGDAPWFWYDTFQLGYEEMVTDVVGLEGLAMYRAVIDSKAMRVLRPDREVQVVIENTTLLTASAVNIGINARFLIGD